MPKEIIVMLNPIEINVLFMGAGKVNMSMSAYIETLNDSEYRESYLYSIR
jgi:hypothetical protein